MESILLELDQDLMDMDEAANLLLEWGVLTEKQVEQLDEELTELAEQDSPELSMGSALTLALIELVQMAPASPLPQ